MGQNELHVPESKIPQAKDVLQGNVTAFPSKGARPNPIPLPCVLPRKSCTRTVMKIESPLDLVAETSKSIRGACFSPFVRAYVPELADVGIDKEAFVEIGRAHV